MFEAFYGLTENPFRMSADEQFRFMHKAYKKAWAYLNYALDKGEGFVLITGRPGTGKTTLIHDTLSDLDSERIRPVRIISNQFQGEELLRLVALELGLQAQEFDKATLLTRIEQYALMIHQEQSRMVVIVDEAQNLSAHGLEELRLLSNLQTGNQPLFQIVLIGQEELRNLIYGQAMENITQRIVASCTLEPMPTEHVQGYVEHRLGIVGWDGDPVFDPRIFAPLQRITHGVPRDINLVMARLLLYGSLEEKHQLNRDDLITVLNELGAEQRLTDDQIALIRELSEETQSDGAEQLIEANDEADEQFVQASPDEDIEENELPGQRVRGEDVSVEELPGQDVQDGGLTEHEDSSEDTREGVISGEDIPDRDHRDRAAMETALDDDQIPDEDPAIEDDFSPGSDQVIPVLSPEVSHGEKGPEQDDASVEMGGPLANEAPASDTQSADAEVDESAAMEAIDEQADAILDPSLALDKERGGDSEREYVDEPLPELHAIPEDAEHRPQGLLTDVDELLGAREEEQSGKGSVWRWFFYPVAIALLVIAILAVRYPDEVGPYWKDFQDWGSQYVNGLSDRLTSQAPQSSSRSPEQRPERDSGQALTHTPSNDRSLTRSGIEAMGEDSPRTQSKPLPDNVLQSLRVSPERPYLLIIDQTSGKLTVDSQPLFARLLHTLRAEPSLFVALTGLSVNESGSLQGMRNALMQAELVSSLLVQEGIAQNRIGVEGRGRGSADEPHTVEFRLRR